MPQSLCLAASDPQHHTPMSSVQQTYVTCVNARPEHAQHVAIADIATGAIKDSVVGEEAIVKYLLRYLGRSCTHSLQALRASGRVSKRPPSHKARSVRTHNSRQDAEADSIRACLYKVLSTVHYAAGSDEPWSDSDESMMPGWPQDSNLQGFAGTGWHPGYTGPWDLGSNTANSSQIRAGRQASALQDALPPPWGLDPGLLDADAELALALQRYEALMQCLGVAGARNPSKEQGALVRLLKAFREGQLGKYMLDDIGPP